MVTGVQSCRQEVLIQVTNYLQSSCIFGDHKKTIKMQIKSVFYAFSLLAFAGMWAACNSGSATKSLTPGGYEYTHHIAKEGAKPETGQYAYFHYQQRIDDTLLDRSRNHKMAKMQIPDAASLLKTPNPIIEGLMKMSPGDSLTVVIPLDSIPQRPPAWADNKNMYFDLVLNEIKTAEEYAVDLHADQAAREVEQAKFREVEEQIASQVQSTITDYTAGKLKGELKDGPGGLKYIIHEAGTGAQAKAQQRVSVNYYGSLTNGTMFDNSFKKGKALDFVLGVGQVIKGWDEGIALLKEGAKATLFIPYQMAYGESGRPPSIPPKSELIFYVELLKVQ